MPDLDLNWRLRSALRERRVWLWFGGGNCDRMGMISA